MPWCDNNITLEGPAEKLAFFISKLENQEGDGLLSAFYPTPDSKIQQLREGEECYLHELHPDKDVPLDQAWYYWRVHNWGTKWDVPYSEISWSKSEKGEEIDIFFQSAWSPPVGWLDTVATLNPDITFTIEFSELGCWFAGRHVWKNGKVVEANDGTPENFEFCEHLIEDDDE